MNKIILEIVTPEDIVYSDEVDMVTVPSAVGTLGILPRHIPLFAQLIEGELKIKKQDQESLLSIGGGFIEVTKTKVIILVTRAVHATQLNEKEILQARQNAIEALKRQPKGEESVMAQVLLRQSLVDLRLMRKMKKRHRLN